MVPRSWISIDFTRSRKCIIVWILYAIGVLTIAVVVVITYYYYRIVYLYSIGRRPTDDSVYRLYAGPRHSRRCENNNNNNKPKTLDQQCRHVHVRVRSSTIIYLDTTRNISDSRSLGPRTWFGFSSPPSWRRLIRRQLRRTLSNRRRRLIKREKNRRNNLSPQSILLFVAAVLILPPPPHDYCIMRIVHASILLGTVLRRVAFFSPNRFRIPPARVDFFSWPHRSLHTSPTTNARATAAQDWIQRII